MTKKYLLLSLEDEKTKSIAEILGNKTANKIISFLSERDEASQKDISDALKMPMNTVEYNIKKMVQAGILEETKNFFWSPKGKRIKMYRFSNKSIVISPKSSKLSSNIKQILPVTLLSGLAAVGIKAYFAFQSQTVQTAESSMLLAADASAKAATESANLINMGDYWLWFLAGALFAIAMFVLKLVLYTKSWEK